MVLYPAVQKKAQAEIDAVVGNDRLPEVNDRPNLPYLEAVLMEVLRYHPIGPMGTFGLYIQKSCSVGLRHSLGIPHCVAQDDVYKGMFIPKDSIVLVNLWYGAWFGRVVQMANVPPNRLIAHNPEIYPNPDKFDPERFYGEQKQLDPQTFVYGFGRRSDLSFFFWLIRDSLTLPFTELAQDENFPTPICSFSCLCSSPFSISRRPSTPRGM